MGRKTKYGEQPVTKISVTLPEEAIENLDAWATKLNMNRSELIAKIGLGKFHLNPNLDTLGEFLPS